MSKVELQQRFKDLVPASERVVGNILKYNSSKVLHGVPISDDSLYREILPQIVIRVLDKDGNYLTPTTIKSVKCYKSEDEYCDAYYTYLEYEDNAWIANVPGIHSYTIVISNNSGYLNSIPFNISQTIRYSLTIPTILEGE